METEEGANAFAGWRWFVAGLELIGCGVEATPAGMSVVRLEKSLREAAVPIISLIRDDAVIFDLRCLRPGDDQIICTELLRLAGGSDE